MPSASRKLVLDRDVGEERAFMLESARRADVIAGQREMHVVALQWVEARVRVSVGHGERAVDAEVAMMDVPTAGRMAEEQRHMADGRTRAVKLAADPAAGERAGKARRVEHDRR